MDKQLIAGLQIRIANIDDQHIWDAYALSHPLATPYHKFAWVQTVEEAYLHKSVSLIATINQQVVGLLPCVKMQNPVGKIIFCSLPFCDLGFVLADNQDIATAIKQHAVLIMQEAGGRAFEYRDSQSTSATQQDIAITDPWIKVRMVLPLPASADALMDGFKSKLRSQIRKSEKNGLTCNIGQSAQSVADFYAIFAKNMRKLGSPVHSQYWFQCLIKNYAEDVYLAIVYKQTIPVGAGLIIKNGDKVAIPWASTDADYNHLAPNMMLYWSLLKQACELGCQQFDFGRSTYGEGTFKFKQQWGAEPVPLLWSDLQAGPSETSVTPGHTSHLRKLVEGIWSRLPLGVTTSLGPKIRKHISL